MWKNTKKTASPILIVATIMIVAFLPVGVVSGLEQPAVLAQQSNEDPRPELVTREVPEQVVLGESFEITFEVTNAGGPAGEWSSISISFPQLNEEDDNNQISVVDESLHGYSTTGVSGDMLTNSDGERVEASYLLYEAGFAEGGSWPAGETHGVTLRVTPEEIGTFQINLRATLTDDDNVEEKFTYPRFSSDHDQQGFQVYLAEVQVVNQMSTDASSSGSQNDQDSQQQAGGQNGGDNSERQLLGEQGFVASLFIAGLAGAFSVAYLLIRRRN